MLYLTAGGALVLENDPAGRTLWKKPGDEISPTDAATYGLLSPAFTADMMQKLAVAFVDHGTVTGDIEIVIPAGSLITGAYAICWETAGGTTRPSIDIGTAEDPDGLFDGLGETGKCDVIQATIGAQPEAAGVGELLQTRGNEDAIKLNIPSFSFPERTFRNTKTGAGSGTVTGAWLILVMYVTLPSLAGIG